jgi:uncharacterized protein YukE
MADVTSAELLVGAEVGEAGPYIRTQSTKFQGELSELRGKLTGLESGWDAASSREYQSYKVMWDTAATDLMGPGGVLDTIAKAMDTVWQNYTETEATNVKNWHH